MSILSDRLLLAIFKRFPAQDVIFKESSLRAAAEYQSEIELPFHRWLNAGPELFKDKELLDLGSGFGGRAARFEELGARVTGIEISEELVSHSIAFAQSKGINGRFLVGTGENIPCRDNQFDLITMFDVMEHVVSPADVLHECWRVLKPGGVLTTVFPPYYNLTAGSHLHGYATTFPGLNLLFTTKALRSAATILLKEQGVEYWRYFRQDVPTDKLWNLNGLTVNRFRAMVRRQRFRVERLDYLGHMEPRLSRHTGKALLWRLPFYYIPRLVAKVPIIQEALCCRVVAVLVK